MAAEPRANETPAEPSSAANDLAVSAAADPKTAASRSLAWRLLGLGRTLRPHQWVKNVFVLAPVVFAKEVFQSRLLLQAASAFAIFCLLAGAVYAMNDVADVAADRVHPVKRFRPIASGRVPLAWARVLCASLVLVSFAWASSLGVHFLAAAVAYFALNLGYSLKLKHIAYVDVGCIAAGFVLRVMAGGFATEITVSKYLLLCTALLALFLGFGKRRHELAMAERRAGKQRAALESYTRGGIDLALATTGIATIASYLSYTLDAHTRAFFRRDDLWLSTVFVLLGVFRFLQIVRHRPRAESPTQEMLRDSTFVAIMLGWVALVMWMVYRLRPS
jgi:decaprenyl-phosphate phosphoribosyltransferase